MTDEIKPTGETPETPVQSASVPVVTQAPPPAEEVFDKDRAMATINALREIEKKAKQDAKELTRLKTEETKRADAELSEIDRLKKQYAEIEANNAKLQADILRRDVVLETGLPSVFADRLKGTTKEEMLADALELLKVLPKQETAQTQTPRVGVTNPGAGGTQITDEARRKFLGLRRTS